MENTGALSASINSSTHHQTPSSQLLSSALSLGLNFLLEMRIFACRWRDQVGRIQTPGGGDARGLQLSLESPELRVYPQGLEKYVLASHTALPSCCQPVRAWLDAGSHKYVYHREGDQGQALSSRVTAETEPAGAALLLRPRRLLATRVCRPDVPFCGLCHFGPVSFCR